jgi:6-phosphogluconate dehydrogenase
MQLAIIGLGKMGANMARRLLKQGVDVVGMNRSQAIVQELSQIKGFTAASGIDDIVNKLSAPRVVWLMLPSGEPTESMLQQLEQHLSPGDIVVEGGNANYHDSQRRAERLAEKSLHFIDAGVSGGIWGLENGYCLMVGGDKEPVAVVQPVLEALAPDKNTGWAHVGPAGAGHFSKMIHNGIEYGMMQAFAEGFSLLQNKQEFDYDLAQLAELWRHGSVVRSWLLDLMAGFLNEDQTLDQVSSYVADSGEGRWTVEESIAQGVPAPVLALALHMRFSSQGQSDYGNKLLAKMREAFGGHALGKS